MQTRSTQRGNNPKFVEQFDRRRIQEAQNVKKRAAVDSSTASHSQSRLTRSITARREQQSDVDSGSGGQQQRRRGQREEQKEDNVIVLDHEESEAEQKSDTPPLPQQQQKRRRVDGTNHTTAAFDTHTTNGSQATTSRSTAVSPRLPPRRPLLSALPHPISQLANFTRQLSSSIGSFLYSPFSSNATHYTRQHNQHNTRSTRPNTTSSTSHTLSHSRWPHSHYGRDEVEEAVAQQDDNDSIDRTFRLNHHHDNIPDTAPYLTYPPHTARGSVTLTYGDLHRLQPNEFLNDTLIEFYLLYIREQVVPARLRDRFHFFNSFLFTRLNEYGSTVRDVYGHVKGWTRGVNLFEKDWIVIPINDADRHHWSLVVIAHPGRAMRPKATVNIAAALTADRARQKQRQVAAVNVKRASNSAGSSIGGGQKQMKVVASHSPTKASLSSNTRQARDGRVQTSIPDLFASQKSPPPSSLLALSSPLLTEPKPHTEQTRSLRGRSHGEELTLLTQQQQQPTSSTGSGSGNSSSRRVTRQRVSHSLLSPENETTRRLTESKGNIRAAMRSPYSKQSHTDNYQQRRQDEDWQRALAVPDEQPTAAETQPADVEEEEVGQTEEKSIPSPAETSSATSAAGVLPLHYLNDVQFEDEEDGVGEVVESDVLLNGVQDSKETRAAEREITDQQADADDPSEELAEQTDVDNADSNIDIETDEADSSAPLLPLITDSVSPTLPLPSQPTLSPTATPVPTIEAGWQPRILHFDSLRILPSQTRKIANILRDYLQCEWEHQQQLHNIPVPPPTLPPPPLTHPAVNHYSVPLQSARDFTHLSFPHADVDVPQQPNDYDCGVYILHFAQLFCCEPWQDVRRLDREGWLDSRMQREGDKRRQMRRLVERLHSEEEFETAALLSQQHLAQEMEQKRPREQQQQAGQMDGTNSARNTDVYVPDSDEEEGEDGRRGGKGWLDRGAVRRGSGGRVSSDQSAVVDDDMDIASESQSSGVNRSISFVPSSQPVDDDEYSVE